MVSIVTHSVTRNRGLSELKFNVRQELIIGYTRLSNWSG